MAFQFSIINNGACIQIINGGIPRNIQKSAIGEVSIIKTSIIKIDIGKGALGNIFIPYADVGAPVTANPDLLREAIQTMLTASAGSGGSSVGSATEANQTVEIGLMNTLNTSINTLKTTVSAMNTTTGLINGNIITTNTGIASISAGITGMNTTILRIDDKIFYEPLIVDDGGAGVIFKGYAALGARAGDAVWAIQRVQTFGEITVYLWANSARTFVNIWDSRELLDYGLPH